MTYKPKPERQAWTNMIHLCYNEEHASYPLIGGLGIQVYEPWRNRETGFQTFITYVGSKPRPSLCLRRYDQTKDYQPGNVYWGPRSGGKRHLNPGSPGPILVTIDGITDNLAGWGRRSGIKHITILARYHRGVRGDRLIEPTHASRNTKRPQNARGLYLLD